MFTKAQRIDAVSSAPFSASIANLHLCQRGLVRNESTQLSAQEPPMNMNPLPANAKSVYPADSAVHPYQQSARVSNTTPKKGAG